MRKIGNRALACSFIIMIVTTTSSHDLWLMPEKFKVDIGETLSISANTGMDFPVSLGAVAPDRISQFVLAGKSGKKEITDFQVQGNSLVAEYVFKEPGTYVIAASLKPKEIKLKAEEFNEYLLHDGLPNIYALREKEGILGKDAVEYYAKFPKTIIQVGSELDETATEPLNLPLEIVPVENPLGLKEGDTLEVTVFFKGEPLTDATLAWSYPGQGETFAGSSKTDETGKAVVPLIKVGPYVLRLIHMEWVKKDTHEWESYWASLTFEVLPE